MLQLPILYILQVVTATDGCTAENTQVVTISWVAATAEWLA